MSSSNGLRPSLNHALCFGFVEQLIILVYIAPIG